MHGTSGAKTIAEEVAPEPSATAVASATRGRGTVRATVAQLRINQRVAQAAVRRANALIVHLSRGLDGTEFADGSITGSSLDRSIGGP